MHQPSLDEMRNQAYQAIISGATGLFWYTYYDLKYVGYPRNKENIDVDVFDKRWADASSMAQEINKITPIILENKKFALQLPKKTDVQAAAWRDGEELLILLANPYYEAKTITFTLPVDWKIKDANQGQIKSPFANGKVTFTLPSVGSGGFRLSK